MVGRPDCSTWSRAEARRRSPNGSPSAAVVLREGGGGRDGCVRGLQEGRRTSGAACRGDPRPVPHRQARRRQGHGRALPAPTRGHRPARHQDRSALSGGRRILLKTASLRTDRQKKRADELLGDPSNKPLALAHGVYQKIIACYAQEDRGKGRGMMAELIESLAVRGSRPDAPDSSRSDAPSNAAWRTSSRSSTTPTARTGRPRPSTEDSRPSGGIALGFRNLDNYITRSLLHTGGFRQAIQTHL